MGAEGREEARGTTGPLLWADLWAGMGCGDSAVLASQADQGSGAQARRGARKALPRLLAWLLRHRQPGGPWCVCR